MSHDDDDLQEEIRAHLAMAAKDRMDAGADAKSAREASLKEFGNVTLIREASRRVWVPRWLDTLRDIAADMRYAVRALVKNPGFSLAVIGVLTLGIGVNSAVFTMLKSIVFTPLAGVQDSAGLRVIYGETSIGRDVGLSYPDFRYLRDHGTSFKGLYGHRLTTVTMGRGREARPAWAEAVTGNYFDVLGVKAQLGRTLQPADESAPGAPLAAVITDQLWRAEFKADPAIVGKPIEVNNRMLEIVGVTDPSYHGTIVSYDVDFFLPITIAPDLGITFGSTETSSAGVLADRSAAMLYVLGWLKPGVSMSEARASTDAIWANLVAARNLDRDGAVKTVRVVPFVQYPTSAQSNVSPMLVALSAMGLLVLVVACANLGGLVVVRAVSRRGEIALRLALGASRARIVRLLIVENLVLAIPGAILGVILAARALPVLLGYAQAMAAPNRLFFNMETDALVIGFAALVACGSAMLFGFAPALRSAKIDLVAVMKEESPRGAYRSGFRSALVVAQVAVSLVLLFGSGLVTRTLDAAKQAERGYRASGTTAVTVDVKANGYDESRGREFYRRLLEAAKAQPGVESAALAAETPLTFLERKRQPILVEGYDAKAGEDLSMLFNVVSPGYFTTLGIPVAAGREFDARDEAAAESVALVNRTMAEKYWGSSASALGKRVRSGDGAWRTVVGVVGDIKYVRVNEAPRPYVYLPFSQAYRSTMVLHTHGAAPIETLVTEARRAVAAVDDQLPVVAARSLEQATGGALIFYNFMSSMLFIFGVAGMGLAAMGTYGLVAYTVKQSTHEIGIRMALGASAARVVRTFVQRGARLGLIGIAIGTAAALGLGTVLRSVLFGVSPTDGVSFAQALAIVTGVVLAATLVPAWRASRTDPLKALRHQ